MIAALLRAMRDRPTGSARPTPSGDPDEDSPAFVRGLALGALVGAAIAGSTLWRRFHGPSPDTPDRPDSTATEAIPE